MSLKDIINHTLKVKILNIFNKFEDKNQALSEIFDFLIDNKVLKDNEKVVFDYLVELGYSQDVLNSKYLEKTFLKSDNDRHPSNFAFMEGENGGLEMAPILDFEEDSNSPN